MVQSAILGFPRMGVNRDLKKATEACQYTPPPPLHNPSSQPTAADPNM